MKTELNYQRDAVKRELLESIFRNRPIKRTYYVSPIAVVFRNHNAPRIYHFVNRIFSSKSGYLLLFRSSRLFFFGCKGSFTSRDMLYALERTHNSRTTKNGIRFLSHHLPWLFEPLKNLSGIFSVGRRISGN